MILHISGNDLAQREPLWPAALTTAPTSSTNLSLFQLAKRTALAIMLMLLMSVGATAQTTYTWASTTAGGLWATAGNWSPSRGAPAANDVLVFNASNNLTITAIPTQTIGRIRNTGTGVVTLQSAGNITVTVQAGGVSPQVDITAGGFVINGSTGNTFNLSVASGNAFTSATGTSFAVTSFSTFTNNGVTFTQNSVNWDMQSGSNYVHAINQGTIPLATWNAASTVNFTSLTNGNGAGSANVTNINQAFGNVSFNCLQTTDLSLNVNSSFSIAGTLLINSNTNGSALTQYNGNGTRNALKLIGSVSGGNVTISLNHITLTGSSNVCLLVLSDAPASGGNTVTVNVGGTITLGNNGNQARLIFAGNTAPATITCTGTSLTNIRNNGSLIFLDQGGNNGCNVTSSMLSSITVSGAGQLWPLRAFHTGATGGINNTLNATVGSLANAATITIGGSGALNVLAQNSSSAANQSNNQSTLNVYGNVIQNSSNPLNVNPTDRSDAIRQVATLNIFKSNAGNDGNLTISSSTVTLGQNNNVLASNGNRSFLNIEGNISGGTITSSNNRNNMVGQVRMFGSASQIGTTNIVNLTNAIDLIIDNGTGNSTTLANNLNLTSGYSYLKLTSGNLNLNSRIFNVGMNTWVWKSLGTISATPTYTAPINYHYSGTTTTGPELSTSFNAGTVVIATGANITSGSSFNFQTRFCGKGTFTQSTSFTTSSVSGVTLTDSATGNTGTTFGQLATTNPSGNNWAIYDLSFNVAGSWTTGAAGNSIGMYFIRGSAALARTVTVTSNFTIGVGSYFDMTGNIPPTLTGNGPDHALNIGGNFTYNNGNNLCRFVYANSGFLQAINVTISGTGSSAFAVTGITSSSNLTFKNLTFNGSGTVSSTNANYQMYGNLINTASTNIVYSGGTTTMMGGPFISSQTLGVNNGGNISFFNVNFDGSGTVVNMAQDFAISGTAINGAWWGSALGINTVVGTNPIFRVNSFNLTFNGTSNAVAFTIPNAASFDAGTGTVTFDIPTGVTNSVNGHVNFNNLVVTNSGGTVSNNGFFNYSIAGDLTVNSILFLANNTCATTFTKAGTQTFSGSGNVTLQTSTINSGSTINATSTGTLTITAALTNNGTFNQTAGTLATSNATGLTDSRTSNNTTFNNLSFSGSGAIMTWDMNCNITNNLIFGSLGSGYNVRLAITGAPDYIQTQNIIFLTGNNGYGIDLTAGGRTLTANLAHTLEINGSVSHTSSNVPNFICYYTNSGFVSALNILIKSNTATNGLDLSSGSLVTYLNNLTIDAATQFATSGIINGRLYGAINNAGAYAFTTTLNRISSYGTTTSITNSGAGSIQLFDISVVNGSTLTLVGAITSAGTGNGTLNFQAAIDVQTGGTLNLGSSTLTTIGGGTAPKYVINGTLTPATSTWVFANTAAPDLIPSGTLTLNNVTLALNGPSAVNMGRGITYIYNGTVDASTFQFGSGVNSNLIGHTINGLFRTANLNGFNTNSSSALSTTNLGTVTLGASSTIEYYANSGTQTVSAFAAGYRALNIINGGTKQAAANFNIQGGSTMTIGTGATFNAVAFTLGMTGAGIANFLINGTFQTGNAFGFNAATGSINTTNTAINQGANGVIEYNGLLAQAVTTISSPSQNYLNLRLSNNVGLSLGASIITETSLTLNGGSLTLGNNDLTLGTSASNLGSLIVNSGLLATTGTGRFIRWFGTTSLPTTTASGVRFPVGTTSSDRSVYVAFSSATALSGGGTIGVNHNLTNGISAVGSPFLDGLGGDQVTINQRTNASWAFTTPSAPTLGGGESILVEARGTNVAAITISSSARFVNVPGPAAGTSVNGTGSVVSPIVYRSGLSLANLTTAVWHIGAPAMQAVVVAINGSAANWATASTWSSATVPTNTDYVVIPSSAAQVNLAGGASYECLTLQVDQGATLNFGINTLLPSSGGIVNIFGTATTQNTVGIALSATGSISNINSPTISFGTTGTANYNGTGAQTITGIQYNNLTISATRSGSPVITLDGSNTIALTGALNITATGVGSYANSGSTIDFNGSLAQTIPAFVGYHNLTSSNTGPRTLASSGNIDLTGILTSGTNAYTITGSTIRFVSSTAQTIPAFNFNNLTSISTGTRTLASSGNICVAGIFTPSTNVYTNTGSTIIFNGTGAQTVPTFSYNNLAINGGRGSSILTMGATVNIAGNLSLNNTVTYDFTSSNSVTNFNGVGNVSQSIPGGTFFTYNNLTISSALTGANMVTFDPTNRVRVRNFNPIANPGGAGYVVIGNTVEFTLAGATIPAFVFNNIQSGNNAYTLPTGGTVEILGIWTATSSATLTPNTSTVRFSNPAAINIPSITPFFNLYVTGAGTKTMIDGFVVNNQLTIDNTNIGISAGQNLQIGTSAANPGSLDVIGTGGVLNTQGNNSSAMSMTRWFGTTGLPTTFSGAGLFPFTRSNNSIISSRYLYVNFSSATALSVGGSVRVSYNNGSGINQDGSVAFTTIVDNTGPTVSLVRGGAYRWVITTPTTPTLAGGQTMGIQLENAGTMRVSIPANTRAINFVTGSGTFVSAAGTSQTGGGTQLAPTCSMTGLSIANLTANNWLLATDKLFGQVIASGLWSNTGIWLGGNIPGTTDDVAIASPYEVSLISNITLNSLNVSNGATLNTNNNVITLGSAQTLTVDGTLKIANPALNQANTSALSTTNAPIIVLGSNSTVEYASSGSQTVDNLNYANLTISNTGSRTINGNVSIGGAFNLIGNNAFTTTGSTINFNGTAALTVPAFNYNNLTISGTRTSNNVTFGGLVSMTGTFSPNASFSSGGYVNTGSTLEFTGTTAATVPSFTYNNLSITGARGSNNVTLGSTIVVQGAFIPSASFGAGNYITTGSSVTFSNTTEQSVPAFNYNNLAIDGARGSNNVTLNGAIGIAGAFNPTASFGSGNYITTSSTVDFNGTGAQTIPAFNFNNLTVSAARASNNVTLASGTIGVNGNLVNTATFGAGTWSSTGNTIDFTNSTAQTIAGSGIILNNLSNSGNGNRSWSTGALSILGTFSTGSGTYTATTNSTVNYAGANGQTIQPTNYYNLTSSNNNRVLGTGGNIDIANDFIPEAGTYTATGSTVRLSGISGNIGSIGGGYNNLILDASAIKALTAATTMLPNATLSLTSGVLNNTSFGLTLGNGCTIIRTAGLINAAPTWGTTANVTYLGGLTTGPELPTSGSILQTLTNNPGSGQTVTLNSSATVNVNLALTSGNFAIASNTLTLPATVSGSGNIRGSATSNLVIAGTTGADVGTLNFGPNAGDRQLNNLDINRNGGVCNMTLGADLGIVGTVTFNGSSTCNILTGANTIDLGTTGAISGEANGRYVVGNLAANRSFNTGTNTFGNIGARMNCTSCNLGSTIITRKSGNGTSVLSGLGTRSINRTYAIVPTTQPATPVDLRLNWVSDDNFYNTPATLGRVWTSTDNGTTWTKVGTLQNFAAGFMDVSATHFSDWTIADQNNPLPLELVSFSGTWDKSFAQLRWTTATETNTSHFEVQRSQNASDFVKIGSIAAAGNSSQTLVYPFADRSAKASQVYYYRLKQVDLDGQFTYSSIIRLNTADGGQFKVYPSPATGITSITMPASANGDYQVIITDAVGKVIKTIDFTNVIGATTSTLNLSGISQGIYFVNLLGPDLIPTIQKLEIR